MLTFNKNEDFPESITILEQKDTETAVFIESLPQLKMCEYHFILETSIYAQSWYVLE